MSMVTSLPVLGNSMHGAIIARDDLSDTNPHSASFAEPTRVSWTNSSEDEKGEKGGNWATETEVVDHSEIQGVVIVNDGRPFPEDPLAPVETQQLTFRAVLVGSALGFVVGAANVYLGLKTGFTFGATLFGSILGFAILKPLSTALPSKFGGGYFGPKENVTVQSAAGAAGGMSGLFVAAIPAMYQLGLLTTPEQDIGPLIALSFMTAFYGLFFAVPLRKYYILRMKLTFPSPTATAFTIRSLHSGATPAARKAAGKKIKILLGAFLFAFLWTIFSKFAPGVIWDWNIGWFLYTWGWSGAINIQNWGWVIEFTPAFHAVGFLTGPNAAFSWLFGAVLAYGIIGPILLATGASIARPIDPSVPGWVNNFSMTTINLPDGSTDPALGTARYWLLWPGVMIMLAASFTELAMQGPMLYRAARGLFQEARIKYGERRGKDVSHIKGGVPDGDEDPVLPHHQVPLLYWVVGICISTATTLVLAKTEFDVHPGLSLLSLILGFMFAFVGVQASGTTDVNPIGVIAKAGQLVIGGITSGQGMSLQTAQLTNLVAGSIVGQSASHSVDMVGDLKTGHLIGASPVSQFWAQLGGSCAGFAFAGGLFIIFAKAYPCINDASIENCPFSLPAVSAWRAVTIAVTQPNLPITLSCGISAIGLGLLASLTVVTRHLIQPKHPKLALWLPNWSAVGLAFVVPQVQYAIAMSTGALIAIFWQRKSAKSWEVWGFALAAGLIAGEGIGGVITAAFVIGEIDGSVYGSAVGCPGFSYCA